MNALDVAGALLEAASNIEDKGAKRRVIAALMAAASDLHTQLGRRPGRMFAYHLTSILEAEYNRLYAEHAAELRAARTGGN